MTLFVILVNLFDMQVKILCRLPAKDKSELSLVERWRDEDPSENLLSFVWDRPLNSLQDVSLPGHRDGGSNTNKITAAHKRELFFLDALASLDSKLSVGQWVIYRFQLARLRVFQIILVWFSISFFFSSKLKVEQRCGEVFLEWGLLQLEVFRHE